MAVTAKKWTCDNWCVSTSRIDGPAGRAAVKELGQPGEADFCLGCRREQAGDAALESFPTTAPSMLEGACAVPAVIEFEVLAARQPHANDPIAKECRSSASAVAQARLRLARNPTPPALCAGRNLRLERGLSLGLIADSDRDRIIDAIGSILLKGLPT